MRIAGDRIASPGDARLTHSFQSPARTASQDWKTISLFIVPSAIYLLQNNIQFLFLKYVDPSTYQILGNLKIASTGILFRFFLKRRLTKLKWMALFLLIVGATTSQVRRTCEHARASNQSQSNRCYAHSVSYMKDADRTKFAQRLSSTRVALSFSPRQSRAISSVC